MKQQSFQPKFTTFAAAICKVKKVAQVYRKVDIPSKPLFGQHTDGSGELMHGAASE